MCMLVSDWKNFAAFCILVPDAERSCPTDLFHPFVPHFWHANAWELDKKYNATPVCCSPFPHLRGLENKYFLKMPHFPSLHSSFCYVKCQGKSISFLWPSEVFHSLIFSFFKYSTVYSIQYTQYTVYSIQYIYERKIQYTVYSTYMKEKNFDKKGNC